MKESRHSVNDIVSALIILDCGICADIFYREYGISRGTPYNWSQSIAV